VKSIFIAKFATSSRPTKKNGTLFWEGAAFSTKKHEAICYLLVQTSRALECLKRP
jgi:hypothetical protein